MGTATSNRTIQVMDYLAEWPEVFASIRARVWPILRDFAIGIEHVGSTAVPGLAAKPIIDIDVIVASRREIPLAVTRLGRRGYRHLGDLGIEDRDGFRPPSDAPAHHLYVCPVGSLALRNHIAVRDYLHAHPSDAAAYTDLKKKLAREYARDRDAYGMGKTEFILSILSKCGFSPDSLDAIRRGNHNPTALGAEEL